MKNTSVTNTINSTEQQFSEDYNLGINRTTPTSTEVLFSNEPPAYRDIPQKVQ